MKNIWIFIGALYLLMGCKFISFQSFHAESNVSGQVLVTDRYCINFSHEINPVDFEEYASLKNGNTQVAVNYYWSGKSCRILPKNGWIIGEKYIFSFSGEINAADGGKYNLNFIQTFYYKTRENYLTLEEIPASNLEIDEALILKFNFSPDKNLFYQSFSLNPQTEFSVTFHEDGKTVTISPKNKWKANTFYQWKLSKPLFSHDGLSLQYEIENFFSTTEDFSPPELEKILINGIDSEKSPYFSPKSRLTFVFNEPVNFSSVVNSVRFSPGINGDFYEKSPSEIEFIPTENFEINTEYEVSCSKTLVDLNGIYSRGEKTFFLTKITPFLTLSEIKINSNPVGSDIYEEKLSLTENSKHSISLFLQFSLPGNFTLNDNFLDFIDLQPIFPSIASSVILTEARYNSEGKILSLNFENLSLPDEDSENFYALEITGGKNGISTDTGYYLEDNICILLKFYR